MAENEWCDEAMAKANAVWGGMVLNISVKIGTLSWPEKHWLEIIIPLWSLVFKNHRIIKCFYLEGTLKSVSFQPSKVSSSLSPTPGCSNQPYPACPYTVPGMGCTFLLWATRFKGTQTGTGKQWEELTHWEGDIKFGFLNPGKVSWGEDIVALYRYIRQATAEQLLKLEICVELKFSHSCFGV